MNLLERTKLTAKKRGFSLSETAVKAGLAEKSIYSWDRSNPKADNLEKVAQYAVALDNLKTQLIDMIDDLK